MAHQLTLHPSRTRPEIVHFLYDRLPVQCKQCGIRFADNFVGKKEMQDHLDMHFRQNRKANQNIGRGHSRSWFIGVEVGLGSCLSLRSLTPHP
jgi:pre-mRNA cleavage complex 2 protein Pcf11